MPALAPALLVLAAAAAQAGQMFVPSGRDTLRALPGVEVIVETVPPALAASGVTGASVKADVVRRFTAAGIRVYATQAENPSVAKAYLDVRIDALPSIVGLSVAVSLELRQTVASLVTESKIVNAVTWDSHVFVQVPPRETAALRGPIEALIDGFIEDWAAVH